MKNYEKTLENLLEQVEKQVQTFEKRRDRQDKKVLWLSILHIFLTGLTTILLGITIADTRLTPWIKNFAFISSVLATSLTGFMNTFQYKEERLITHQTLNFLKELRAKIRIKQCQIADDPENIILGKRETDNLYEEFQTILNEGNLSWRHVMRAGLKKGERGVSPDTPSKRDVQTTDKSG